MPAFETSQTEMLSIHHIWTGSILYLCLLIMKGKKMDHANKMHPQDSLKEQYHDAGNFKTRMQALQQVMPHMLHFYPWVFNQITAPPDAQVLELGCGPGHLWQENLERIPPDWSILLSDFSPGMLKGTQQYLAQSRRPFAFQVIDAQDIPFEDARFDLLIANLMLYHVSNLPRALAEIRRVLKPDGSLYAATVSAADFAPLEELVNDAGMPFQIDVKGFHLENGAEQLAPWFSHVTLSRLESPLVLITEIEPFFTFTRTMLSQSHYSETEFGHLHDRMQQVLSQQGGIRWQLAVGLFKASNRT